MKAEDRIALMATTKRNEALRDLVKMIRTVDPQYIDGVTYHLHEEFTDCIWLDEYDESKGRAPIYPDLANLYLALAELYQAIVFEALQEA